MFSLHNIMVPILEQFPLEHKKIVSFELLCYKIGLKTNALFHPIRSKSKLIMTLLHMFSCTLLFLDLSATCVYFEVWLAHLIAFVLCDWLEWSRWCWFYNTQLKTTLVAADHRWSLGYYLPFKLTFWEYFNWMILSNAASTSSRLNTSKSS